MISNCVSFTAIFWWDIKLHFLYVWILYCGQQCWWVTYYYYYDRGCGENVNDWFQTWNLTWFNLLLSVFWWNNSFKADVSSCINKIHQLLFNTDRVTIHASLASVFVSFKISHHKWGGFSHRAHFFSNLFLLSYNNNNISFFILESLELDIFLFLVIIIWCFFYCCAASSKPISSVFQFFCVPIRTLSVSLQSLTSFMLHPAQFSQSTFVVDKLPSCKSFLRFDVLTSMDKSIKIKRTFNMTSIMEM